MRANIARVVQDNMNLIIHLIVYEDFPPWVAKNINYEHYESQLAKAVLIALNMKNLQYPDWKRLLKELRNADNILHRDLGRILSRMSNQNPK